MTSLSCRTMGEWSERRLHTCSKSVLLVEGPLITKKSMHSEGLLASVGQFLGWSLEIGMAWLFLMTVRNVVFFVVMILNTAWH